MNPRLGVLILSVLLFIVSLLLPAFGKLNGLSAWVFGPFGLFYGASPTNFTWLANPLLFCSWIALAIGSSRWTLILGVTALIVGLSFMVLAPRFGLVTDESGVPRFVIGYRSGYWLWLLSMGLVCFGRLFCASRISTASRSLSGRY